jgi:hypothetical protein
MLQRSHQLPMHSHPHPPHRTPPSRHIWTGYRPYGQQVRQLLEERRNKTNAAPLLSQPPPATDYNPGEDDALSTLMQVCGYMCVRVRVQ